jgi:signal transduction histidine kinase
MQLSSIIFSVEVIYNLLSNAINSQKKGGDISI